VQLLDIRCIDCNPQRSRLRDTRVRLRRIREQLDLARTASDFARTAADLVRATTDGICHIVADGLSSSRHVVSGVGNAVHDVDDTRGNGLQPFGRRVTHVGSRISHTLTKCRREPGRKTHRQPRPNRTAGDEPHQKAAATVPAVALSSCIHFWFSHRSL
jgi:hypothetical protein